MWISLEQILLSKQSLNLAEVVGEPEMLGNGHTLPKVTRSLFPGAGIEGQFAQRVQGLDKRAETIQIEGARDRAFGVRSRATPVTYKEGKVRSFHRSMRDLAWIPQPLRDLDRALKTQQGRLDLVPSVVDT